MSILNSTKNYLLNKSGVQQHFDENEILRAAANKGLISNELYNKMGGFNFKENVPYAGDFGTGLGSLAYNVAQSVLSNQPISEIPGDVARNYMGAAAGLTKEEKDLYDKILGKREPAFNLASAAGKVKDAFGNFIFTPAGAGSDVTNFQDVDITEELDNYYEEGERMPNVKDVRERGLGELLKSLSGGVVNFGKDIASRGIMSKALGGVGNIVFGMPGAMMGSLAGLIKGGDMFKQSYDPFYKQFADPSQGGAGFKDRYGINTASAFGDYGKYALNKAYGVNALGGDKGDFYRDVVAKKNAAMTDANIGFEDRGSDSGSSQSSSRESAVEQEQSNRDAARGRF